MHNNIDKITVFLFPLVYSGTNEIKIVEQRFTTE